MHSNLKSWLLIAAVLACLVLAGHGWNVRSGLFLDDHAHYRHLRQGDWSYRTLVEASWLGVVGDVMDLWFAGDTGLHFYRPLAFALLKIEYLLAGWRPTGMHLFSLGWHWLCAMLVASLAWRCMGRAFWAAVAAGIFAIHPAHVATVAWIACQTELMVTALALTAVCCYWRYSGWPVPLLPPAAGPAEPVTAAPAGRTAWLAGALAAFAAALGCRENAVIIPLLLLLGDLMFRRPWRRRLPVYSLLAAMLGAYFLLRWQALGGFVLPGRPYLVRPGDPQFLPFVRDKLAYCLLGLFGFVPVLPIGGLKYLRCHPVSFWAGVGGVLVGWAVLIVAFRARRGLVYWSAWIVISLLPVGAIFASPHHLYLPGVAMAVMTAAGLAMLAGLWQRRQGRPGRARRLAATVALAIVGLTAALLCWAYGWVFRAATSVEDLVVAEVIDHGRPLRDGDKLFFINLPLIAYYATPAIEQASGRRNLRGYVLTVSPTLLRMDEPCQVRRLSAKQLSVSLERNGYFTGAMGGVLKQLLAPAVRLDQGQRIRHELFEVTVARAGPEGVRELIFQFDRPLASPDYHFYLGSRLRLACSLDFSSDLSEPADAAPAR